MQTHQHPKPKPVVVAERRADAATAAAARDRIEAQRATGEAARLAAELAEMREDRDRWRTQAERLAAALERLKVSTTSATESERAMKSDSDDVLYGLPAIALAFGWRPRQAEHLKDAHGMPTYKIGKTVCARRGAISAWLAQQDGSLSQEGR